MQAPGSAKFDGMPRSAIDAGLADVVAPAEELPEQDPRLPAARARASPRRERPLEEQGAERAGEDLRPAPRADRQRLLAVQEEHHLPPHRAAHGAPPDRQASRDYVRFLQENPREIDLLFKELLIGVTSFFRDPAAWEQLRERGHSRRCSRHARAAAMLRAWVPGCSTGEEAYSLAMVFKEALEPVEAGEEHRAPDLRHRPRPRRDRQGAARASIPANIAADVSPERLRRFFVQEERGYRVAQGDPRDGGLRAAEHHHGPAVHQARHPVLPQPAHLPVAGAAEEAHPALPLQPESRAASSSSAAPRPSARFTDLFAPLDGKTRHLPAARVSPRGAVPVEFPSRRSPTRASPSREPQPTTPKRRPPNLQTLADRLLVQRFSPAGVLVQRQGRHPLHQRPHRQVPRAGGRQGQPGTSSPWRARACATSSRSAFSQGAAASDRAVDVRGRQGRDQRRDAGRRPARCSSSPSRRRCAGRC